MSSHSHYKRKSCTGLDVPSAVDLLAAMEQEEKIITPQRIYVIRYPKTRKPRCITKIHRRGMLLEHQACSGRLSIGQWLKAVRKMGFVVRVKRK